MASSARGARPARAGPRLQQQKSLDLYAAPHTVCTWRTAGPLAAHTPHRQTKNQIKERSNQTTPVHRAPRTHARAGGRGRRCTAPPWRAVGVRRGAADRRVPVAAAAGPSQRLLVRTAAPQRSPVLLRHARRCTTRGAHGRRMGDGGARASRDGERSRTAAAGRGPERRRGGSAVTRAGGPWLPGRRLLYCRSGSGRQTARHAAPNMI